LNTPIDIHWPEPATPMHLSALLITSTLLLGLLVSPIAGVKHQKASGGQSSTWNQGTSSMGAQTGSTSPTQSPPASRRLGALSSFLGRTLGTIAKSASAGYHQTTSAGTGAQNGLNQGATSSGSNPSTFGSNAVSMNSNPSTSGSNAVSTNSNPSTFGSGTTSAKFGTVLGSMMAGAGLGALGTLATHLGGKQGSNTGLGSASGTNRAQQQQQGGQQQVRQQQGGQQQGGLPQDDGQDNGQDDGAGNNDAMQDPQADPDAQDPDNAASGN